ncbi:hypothetical protein VHEMI01194 [[Torrubiella] hemipterigena]|uniref:Prion-inhibition and propagation HeLo domain-containing protein n=1 Tax=[Torrubiella] hemipterigena TaxID=1531966 RepID=A0A0A1T442_9HYPO|nr:hypothetical protein VHEMI01194 [[Torrubiella] hemipterigena]
MDPASAAGLAIGVASLVFEVFDSSVKVFKFLSLMVDMPKDYKHCQLKLVIEYNRLLAWGKAVGLIDATEDSDVAKSLGTNAVELCSVLSRIRWLLEEFREINNRWKTEITNQSPDYDSLEASDVSEMVSHLEIAYEETKSKEIHKRVRKQSRVKQWMSKLVADARDISAHPSRIRWAVVDKKAFEELLEDLRFLTGRLHQLLVDHRQKRVADITAETYRELVLTRTNVEELKAMLEAMNSLMNNPYNLRADCDTVNDKTFRDLLRLKEINRTADMILANLESDDSIDIHIAWNGLINVPEYNGATLPDYFIHTDENDNKTTSKVTRARGALIRDES